MTTTSFAAESRAPRLDVNTSVRTERNAAAKFARPFLTHARAHVMIRAVSSELFILEYTRSDSELRTTLVVQVEQSVGCVSLCVSQLNDLQYRYVAHWFILTLSRSSSKVKVIVKLQDYRRTVFLFFSYGCLLGSNMHVLKH